MPVAFRSNLTATLDVVKDPENGSSIISLIFEDAFIIRSNNTSGFCVGKVFSVHKF